MGSRLYKDEVLNQLASRANVAQFVSYGPGGDQRFARILNHDDNDSFHSIENAAKTLLQTAPDGMVNVRSFTPSDTKNREFVYGLTRPDDIAATVRRLNASGLFAIMNETIDVKDGGVSGVVMSDIIEFAPGDTPRCVEKPGVASFCRQLGLRLLEQVYRFPPSLDYDPSLRVEFSLHPLRRGFCHEHTIIWELEDVASVTMSTTVNWPNKFSRHIGDKTFGLLIADLIGLPVPRTTVIARGVPPFEFGTPTMTGEIWVRTCPAEQVPGRYTTHFGWLDPFQLMSSEDVTGEEIVAVISQEGVSAGFSGALITSRLGEPIIEGVSGRGTEFMLGRQFGEVPEPIRRDVVDLFDKAVSVLGPVRFEWVHDGSVLWVVQLHCGPTPSSARTIFPGEARYYHSFQTTEGIDALRELIRRVKGSQEGIVLIGNIGVTSHLGDLLRQAKIPSRVEPPAIESVSQ